MKNSRRKFIARSGAAMAGLTILPSLLAEKVPDFSINPPENASDEDFWKWVKHSYTQHATLINLNNGGVSPQPKIVQDTFEHYNRFCNEGPSYFMWRKLDESREPLRKNMARFAGCNSEEIAFCRNSSEALETIIFGLDLKKGDEVLVTNYDYPNMRNAWKQREARDGIVLKWIKLPIRVEDPKELVDVYADAITDKTKVVHLTHLINWTGQLVPAKEIAEMAHKRGAVVVLDAAHSLAHFEMSLSDINCDYAGFSLHKWLCAPFGTGMLYVKKDKISGLWPLLSPEEPKSPDIRKFEALGTRSFPAEMAIGKALDFHLSIGPKRKQDRLHFLKTYWVDKVKEHPKIVFYSPLGKQTSGAIATVGVKGKKGSDFEEFLLKKYHIHTVPIEWEEVNGVRVTPHIYTSLEELDRLVEGILEFAGGE